MSYTKREMYEQWTKESRRSGELVSELRTEIDDLRHFVEWVSDGGPPGDPVQRREEAQQARELLDKLYGKDAVDQAAGARVRAGK